MINDAVYRKTCQLREENSYLLQRQISAVLETDNALYCRLERGHRSAKREQVVKLTELFSTDTEELLTLWLGDKITMIINDDELAEKALKLVQQNIINKN